MSSPPEEQDAAVPPTNPPSEREVMASIIEKIRRSGVQNDDHLDASTDAERAIPQIVTSCADSNIITYSSKELRRIRESKVARKWPHFLDQAFKNIRGHWDPDRWHQNRKRGSTPPPSEKEEKVGGTKVERPQSSLSADGKSRRDAKDRIKAEQDGIVLSPQRRSFLTGCQVSQTSSASAKAAPGACAGNSVDDEARNHDREEISLRPEKAGSVARRIVGSGRLGVRPEGAEDYDRRFERFGFRRGAGNVTNEEPEDPRRRDRSKERERRISERDRWVRNEERDPDAYGPGSRRGPPRAAARNEKVDRRGGSRFPRRGDNDSQPEWMSETVEQGGELMELRGFEDSPEKEPALSLSTGRPSQKERSKHRNGIGQEQHSRDVHTKEETEKAENVPQCENSFNLDDFLHLDSIPGLANILADDASDVPKTELPQQSRFSKFFNRPNSPEQHGHGERASRNHDERRSSIQDELGINNGGLLRNISGQPSINIPSPSEGNSFYFAPISPAAKTASHPHDNNALMDLLRINDRRGREDSSFSISGPRPPTLSQLQGKDVKSVEELEANLRHMVGLGSKQERSSPTQQHHADEHDVDALSAFKKFAAMLENSSGHNGGPPMETVFPQMMNHQRPVPPTFLPGLVRPSPIPAHALSEQDIINTMRPQHSRQMRMPLPEQRPMHPDLLQLIHQAPFNLEVLQRQEAHTLQRALDTGDASPQSLLQQFAHANLPGLHREILLNVLKVQQNQGRLPTRMHPQQHLQLSTVHPNLSQRTSPLQESLNHALFHQQQLQQQQRPSPSLFPQSSGANPNNLAVSPTSGQQRIPSPQELVYHTQQIMQNALIRRKLEEQKENYRKRTEGSFQKPEQERSFSEVKSAGTDSPVPLNFTPTVVMKKLAADRRDSDPRPQIPELRVSQMSEIGPDGDGSTALHRFTDIKQLQQQHNRSSPLSPGGSSNAGGAIGRGPLMQGGIMPPVPLPPPNPLLMMHPLQQAQALQMAAIRGRLPDPRLVHQHHFLESQQARGPMPSMDTVSQMASGGMANQQQNLGGGLSRFFSPEVIAQAQSGNAPSMPPLPTQKAMTLEEIERQAAAVSL